MIKDQEAIHLENIAHQALDSQAINFEAAGSESLARPDRDIMRQGFQFDQYLQRFETALVTFAGGDSLVVCVLPPTSGGV